MNFPVPQYNARAKYQPGKYYRDIEDDAALWKSPVTSSRSLKRILPCGSTAVQAQNGHVQKFRAIEKEGQKHRASAAPVSQKNMHASSNHIVSNGYNQMEMTNQNVVPGSHLIRSSELNDSNSDASSVGSCSITKQSQRNYYGHFRPTYCKETDALCSDAESYSCHPGTVRKSSSLPPKEGLEVSIRRLELHAYRSTLEALYASGPLTWDQEEMLTNLRMMLHISNDEHLQELRLLISPKTAIGVR